MKKFTIVTMTPVEVKEADPKRFQTLYINRKQELFDNGYMPSQDQIEDSFEAALDLFGSERDGYGNIDVVINIPKPKNYKNRFLYQARALAWLENKLSLFTIPYGLATIKKYGKLETKEYYKAGKIKPCPLTGWCYDECFINAIREGIMNGNSLEDTIKRLSEVKRKLVEEEWEYYLSEESFLESDEEFEIKRELLSEE